MGKAARAKRARIPSDVGIENPICPTCGRRDKLYEAEGDVPNMMECDRCDIQFWIEEKGDPFEGEDDGAFTKCQVCLGRGCKACLPSHRKSAAASAAVLVASPDPVVGEMVELSHGS